MALTNDLLLYESRKRAIDRVRKMQEETRKKVEEGRSENEREERDIEKELFEKEENRGFEEGQNNHRNFDNSFNMNNSFNMPQNKRGLTGIIESLFKGNGSALNMLKGQIGEVSAPLKGIMDYFDLDSEKIIILMVMWVLFSEKQDKTLLLALGYLLI